MPELSALATIECLQVQRPYPLLSAPLLRVWARYWGREYSVFVDESFSRLLNMTEEDSRYGYFSYGGVGVQSDEYDSLRIAMAGTLGRYLALEPNDQKELKHGEFKRLPYSDRCKLATQMARTLANHGAFVSGFYRPGHSFVMEWVRDAVMYEEQLPDDVSALYRSAVEQIRTAYYRKGGEVPAAVRTASASRLRVGQYARLA